MTELFEGHITFCQNIFTLYLYFYLVKYEIFYLYFYHWRAQACSVLTGSHPAPRTFVPGKRGIPAAPRWERAEDVKGFTWPRAPLWGVMLSYTPWLQNGFSAGVAEAVGVEGLPGGYKCWWTSRSCYCVAAFNGVGGFNLQWKYFSF